jgi:hypothetical protein
MQWIGLVIAIIAALLALLDIVLWGTVSTYRTHRLLQWALLVLAIAVIVGVHGVVAQ